MIHMVMDHNVVTLTVALLLTVTISNCPRTVARLIIHWISPTSNGAQTHCEDGVNFTVKSRFYAEKAAARNARGCHRVCNKQGMES